MSREQHGWSEHGSSIIPAKHSVPQDLYSPCLNYFDPFRPLPSKSLHSNKTLTLFDPFPGRAQIMLEPRLLQPCFDVAGREVLRSSYTKIENGTH